MRNWRLPFTLIILAAIIFLPYWVYVPVLFAAIAVLAMFWEGILLGLSIDALYGPHLSFPLFPFALSAFVLLIISIPLRARLRTYV